MSDREDDEDPTAKMSYKEIKRQWDEINENIYNDDKMKIRKKIKKSDPLYREDFGVLDIRIGKILRVEQNPFGKIPSFLQNIDIGEEDTCLVISDLCGHYTEEEMMHRRVVVLCNIRGFRRRGLLSEGWLLAARRGKHMELLDPPAECDPGDQVTVEGFPPIQDLHNERIPSLSKIERIFKDLRIDSDSVAVFRGKPLQVEGRHKITVKSASDCPVTDAVKPPRPIKYKANYNPYIKESSPKNDPVIGDLNPT